MVASEPDGGATVAWQDARGGFAPTIGFQRLSPAGLLLPQTEPVAVGPPPVRAGLALPDIRPNPTRREFTASFSLPDGGPARLEMLDLLGRRVTSVDVGGRGAGTQSVRLRPSGLRPGLYRVRLVHASGTRVTKAVLVP